MASITIQHSHRNLLFAAQVATETGASFEESGQWITISQSPILEIPRYIFNQNFDQPNRDQPWLERVWRSLTLNKRGYLIGFSDTEIVISDDPPKSVKAPFLLRFPDEEAKAEAEAWAKRLNQTLTDYLLDAVIAYNAHWQEQSAN